MSTVNIPAWNSTGVLPPIDISDPTGIERSPYPVRLIDVLERFCTSQQRHSILCGFLEYRAAIHGLGFVDGFQWLDGSFLEDVELLEHRSPNDIDVVTFLRSPSNIDPLPNGWEDVLSNPMATKSNFRVDGYTVALFELPSDQIVIWGAYWYSMWSHKRSLTWKGFLQVDLAMNDDSEALRWMSEIQASNEW